MSFQVGDRDDSNLYISMKVKAAAEVEGCVLSIFIMLLVKQHSAVHDFSYLHAWTFVFVIM